MKPSLMLRSAQILLLIILAGIIIHAPLVVFTESHIPSLGLIAKAWKEMIMVIVGGLLLIEITRRQQWKWVLQDKLLVISTTFILLNVAMLGYNFQSWQVTIAGLMIDLRYVAFFVEIYIVLHLLPGSKRAFIHVAVGGAIVVVGFAFLQLFLPHNILSALGYSKSTISPYLTIDKNPLFVRENSTLRGPNPLGAYGASVILFLAAYLRETWTRKRDTKRKLGLALFGLAAFAAVVVSYSRGAWVGCVVACVIAIIWWLPTIKLWQWVSVGLVVGLVTVGIISYRHDAFVSSIIFHNNPHGSSVKSDTQHVSSLENATKNTLTHPLGDGIGSTGSASLLGSKPVVIENQYLFIAHEAGWLGLGLFIWLVGLILWRLTHEKQNWLVQGVILSGICLLIINLVLPIWADDTISIVWWGLAALALDGGRSVQSKHERSSHKKTA